MSNVTTIDPSKLSDDLKARLAAEGIDLGPGPVQVGAAPQAILTLDQLKEKSAKTPELITIDEYNALREDFVKNLKPADRLRPEFWPVGSKNPDGSPLGPPPARTHIGTRIGAAALNDDVNLVLVACGQITGGNPPTVLGKSFNWGSLTRTGAGLYNITLGTALPSNTAAEQWTFWFRTVVASLPCIKVTDTSDTVKAFTCLDNNVGVDTMVFGFALWRQPFTS